LPESLSAAPGWPGAKKESGFSLLPSLEQADRFISLLKRLRHERILHSPAASNVRPKGARSSLFPGARLRQFIAMS
jgi:hypothetical protein